MSVLLSCNNSKQSASNNGDDEKSQGLQVDKQLSDTVIIEEQIIELPISKEKLVWMSTDPIQCLGNPWEKDWISQPGNKYENYPVGHPAKIEKEEVEIIKGYFNKKGIYLAAVESKPYPDNAIVCDACECPVGYTLLVKIPENLSEKLLGMGFNQVESNK